MIYCILCKATTNHKLHFTFSSQSIFSVQVLFNVKMHEFLLWNVSVIPKHTFDVGLFYAFFFFLSIYIICFLQNGSKWGLYGFDRELWISRNQHRRRTEYESWLGSFLSSSLYSFKYFVFRSIINDSRQIIEIMWLFSSIKAYLHYCL